MNETIEGTAVAIREPAAVAAPGLFTAMRPAEKVAYATEVAGVLKDVLVKRNLIKRIGNSDHVELEGWQTCASIVGVSARIEWTRALEAGNGWECRAVVITAQGLEVGAGEGMCSRDESTWKKRDDFALRAMAQTRAMSRALRGVLAWIVVLAGYKPTPASEMVDAPPPPSQPSSAPRGLTKNEAAAAKATAGGACVECNAPAGKPHATACKVGRPPDPGRPQQAEADAARQSALRPMDDLRVPPEHERAPGGREGAATGCLRGCTASGHAKDCANGPMTENQRGLLFALHGDLKHDDVARHAFYEAVAGVRSSRELTRATAKLTIDALRAEKEAAL